MFGCVYLLWRAALAASLAHLVPLDQQGLQPGDLGPQFSDQPDVGVLVDGGLVDDVLGSVGVAQRAERLAVVDVGRGDGCRSDRVIRLSLI